MYYIFSTVIIMIFKTSDLPLKQQEIFNQIISTNNDTIKVVPYYINKNVTVAIYTKELEDILIEKVPQITDSITVQSLISNEFSTRVCGYDTEFVICTECNCAIESEMGYYDTRDYWINKKDNSIQCGQCARKNPDKLIEHLSKNDVTSIIPSKDLLESAGFKYFTTINLHMREIKDIKEYYQNKYGQFIKTIFIEEPKQLDIIDVWISPNYFDMDTEYIDTQLNDEIDNLIQIMNKNTPENIDIGFVKGIWFNDDPDDTYITHSLGNKKDTGPYGIIYEFKGYDLLPAKCQYFIDDMVNKRMFTSEVSDRFTKIAVYQCLKQIVENKHYRNLIHAMPDPNNRDVNEDIVKGIMKSGFNGVMRDMKLKKLR